MVHDSRLLMVERAGSHGAGMWCVPGGWLEMWEHPAACAEREVKEETGLAVEAYASAGWSNNEGFYEEGVHSVTLWVRCRYLGGEPSVVEPQKCPRVEWVPVDQVMGRPLFSPLLDWWVYHRTEFLP